MEKKTSLESRDTRGRFGAALHGAFTYLPVCCARGMTLIDVESCSTPWLRIHRQVAGAACCLACND